LYFPFNYVFDASDVMLYGCLLAQSSILTIHYMYSGV